MVEDRYPQNLPRLFETLGDREVVVGRIRLPRRVVVDQEGLVAVMRIASLSTSQGWTIEALSDPLEMASTVWTWFRVFRCLPQKGSRSSSWQ